MKAIYHQELFYRPEFKAMIQMALNNELNYISGKPVADQTDEEKALLQAWASNFGAVVDKCANFVINDPSITAKFCWHEVDEDVVNPVVVSVVAAKKRYLV